MAVREHPPKSFDGGRRDLAAERWQVLFHKGPYEVDAPFKAGGVAARQIRAWEGAPQPKLIEIGLVQLIDGERAKMIERDSACECLGGLL